MAREFLPAADRDVPALVSLITDAFAGPADAAEAWVRTHSLSSVRVVRDEDRPISCAIRIPMAQHFGGRPVPMVGIAGVAVSPVHRGAGLARDMMARVISELAAEGAALSTLYASTRPLYRQVGYEAAGCRFSHRLPVARLARLPGSAPVSPLSDADLPLARACYERAAPAQQGSLLRGEYCWSRIWKNRDDVFRGFGVRAGGELEGYVALRQQRKPETGHHDLVLNDFVATTPAAVAALSTFLAGFATMADDVVFHAGASHPLSLLMPHHHGGVTLHEPWMLRVCHVPRALEARGYPAGISATLALDIRDEVVPSNAGQWTLTVRDGTAKVARGASGPALSLDIRGLAAIYTSFLSPTQAQLAGLVQGNNDLLAQAGAIFAGPAPSMSDFF
ncbi:MAG: GNAT family N-acetyltransferase [Leptolyngbya sp. PLA1]|nr:GNAT family N-acetyltransferase [Leptolyngbya sp. PLA1]